MSEKTSTWVCAVAVISLLSITSLSVVFFNSTTTEHQSVDVIVIAGQSNAEYMPERCDVESFRQMYPEEPVQELFYFGTPSGPQTYWGYENSDNSLDGARLMNMWEGHWKIGGYEPYIANETAKITGNDVIVLNTGVGGKMVSELRSDAAFGEYGFGLISTALKQASKLYSNVNTLFWVWAQGEADYITPVQDYILDFNDIRQEFASLGFGQCYIAHTRDAWGGNANIAQESIASNDPDVHIIGRCTESFSLEEGGCLLDEPGCYGIHYSCKGRVMIAESLMSELRPQYNQS